MRIFANGNEIKTKSAKDRDNKDKRIAKFCQPITHSSMVLPYRRRIGKSISLSGPRRLASWRGAGSQNESRQTSRRGSTRLRSASPRGGLSCRCGCLAGFGRPLSSSPQRGSLALRSRRASEAVERRFGSMCSIRLIYQGIRS